MSAPTDPLPEPLYWYEYTKEGWSAKATNMPYSHAAWTFNPHRVKANFPIEGYEGSQPDVWVVRSQATSMGHVYDAVFPTRDEATHYISVRAMLGTFELRENGK